MESTREMVLIPSEYEQKLVQSQQKIPKNSPKPKEKSKKVSKSSKENIFSRKSLIDRISKIALPLAKINAYDDNLNIRSFDGSKIENSSICTLLEYAMTPGKALIGEDEFVAMLYQAKIDPDLIINSNLKRKLLVFIENQAKLKPWKRQQSLTQYSSNIAQPKKVDFESQMEFEKEYKKDEETETEESDKEDEEDEEFHSFSETPPKIPLGVDFNKGLSAKAKSSKRKKHKTEPIKFQVPEWDIPID